MGEAPAKSGKGKSTATQATTTSAVLQPLGGYQHRRYRYVWSAALSDLVARKGASGHQDVGLLGGTPERLASRCGVPLALQHIQACLARCARLYKLLRDYFKDGEKALPCAYTLPVAPTAEQAIDLAVEYGANVRWKQFTDGKVQHTEFEVSFPEAVRIKERNVRTSGARRSGIAKKPCLVITAR